MPMDRYTATDMLAYKEKDDKCPTAAVVKYNRNADLYPRKPIG